MNDLTFVLLLALATTTLFFAVVSIPRWFVRSLLGHRMWGLRDQIVDDALSGRLNAEHDAVRQLFDRTEWAVQKGRRLNMLDFMVFTLATAGMDPKLREHVELEQDHCAVDGLSDGEKALVQDYRDRFDELFSGAMILGSWIGIVFAICFLPRAIKEIRAEAKTGVRAGQGERADVAVTHAAGLVVTETRFGQRSHDFVRTREIIATAH